MLFAGRVETSAGRQYGISSFSRLEAEAVAVFTDWGIPQAVPDLNAALADPTEIREACLGAFTEACEEAIPDP